MQITHTEHTAITLAENVDGLPADLVGAIYRGKVRNKFHVFEAVGMNRFDEVLNDTDQISGKHVQGATSDQIMSELLDRYPCPVRDATYVIEVSRFAFINYSQVNGWVVLNYPELDNCESVEELTRLSDEFGKLYLSTDLMRKVFCTNGQSMACIESHGFIVSQDEDTRLWAVNHNPRALLMRDYVVKRKAYEERNVNRFPESVLRKIFVAISPDQWPRSHPFQGCVSTIDLTSKGSGRGHKIKNITLDLETVIKMLRLNSRLNKLPFWRSYDFNVVLKNGLEFIHGVEHYSRKTLVRFNTQANLDYQTYVETFSVCKLKATPKETERDSTKKLYSGNAPVTIQTFKAIRFSREYTEDQARQSLLLARFIRREAKIAGLEIPRAPVAPKCPPTKRQLAKSKKRRPRGEGPQAQVNQIAGSH